ncbi:hypothetical protein NEOKW01_1042 [Nematocida sp. AWRm80]|nr:hypothetical protein NEOKW01_1042 [Nematocida sp. AWRm80]
MKYNEDQSCTETNTIQIQTRYITAKESTNIDHRTQPQNTSKEKTISKVSIEIDTKTNQKTIYAIGSYYDLLEVQVNEIDLLNKCSTWKIDSVKIKVPHTKTLYLKKGQINKLITAEIAINIDISEYYQENPRYWLYNTKEILRLSREKNIIFSSTRKITDQEKEEVFKALKLKERTVTKITEDNPERMIIRAAIRKYAYQGTLVHVLPTDSFFKRMVLKARRAEKNLGQRGKHTEN